MQVGVLEVDVAQEVGVAQEADVAEEEAEEEGQLYYR